MSVNTWPLRMSESPSGILGTSLPDDVSCHKVTFWSTMNMVQFMSAGWNGLAAIDTGTTGSCVGVAVGVVVSRIVFTPK